MDLIALAIIPIFICGFYIYFRDKYEKEPYKLLFLGLFYGALFAPVIAYFENYILLFLPISGRVFEVFYHSFLVASLVEEFFKFIIVYFLIKNNNNFNEKYDGVVYCVFVSLGFALVENILYVINPVIGGFDTAIARSIFSVPAHSLFGVNMGYYFSMYKFEQKPLFLAFLSPFILHGFYDFFLMINNKVLILAFILLLLYMWVWSFKKIKILVASSPFKV